MLMAAVELRFALSLALSAAGFGRARRAPAVRALGLLIPTLFAAAAAQAYDQAEQRATELARFERFAGDPVTEVQHFDFRHFEVLGRTTMAVWGRPGQVYLLTLTPPCTELQWANAVALRTSFDNLHVGHDYVIARGQRCFLDSIRPVDEPALQASRKTESKR
jgi:hypothetical protein